MSLKIPAIIADLSDMEMLDARVDKKRTADDLGLQDLSSSPTKRARSPVKSVTPVPTTPEKLVSLFLDFQASSLDSPPKNNSRRLSRPGHMPVRRALFPFGPDVTAAVAKTVADAEKELDREVSRIFDTFRHKRKIFKALARELATEVPLAKMPVQTGNQTNGSWFIYNGCDLLGVYKPRLQAKGALDGPSGKPLRKGIPLGQEALREKLADVLNKTLRPLINMYISLSDFGVPQTTIEPFMHALFGPNHEVGSFQCYEKGTRAITDKDSFAAISEDQFIKAAIFDLLSLNTDRHLGNLLYSEVKGELILIDHGACFPEQKGLKEVQFEWMRFSFAQSPLPARWQKFVLAIDTKMVVNKLLQASIKLDTKLPENQMRITNDALLVLAHAIQLLKKWVQERPELSICDFARGYVRESVPVATLSDSKSYSRNFLLGAEVNRSNFDPGLFCEEHCINEEEVGVYFNRKSVGGAYIPAIQKSCKQIAHLPLESALDVIASGFGASLCKTTQELIDL